MCEMFNTQKPNLKNLQIPKSKNSYKEQQNKNL